MPWTSRIDVPGRLVHTSVSGTLRFPDAIEHRVELAADPAFDPTYLHLLDLGRVERVDIDHRDVVLLASESILAPQCTQVIVAPTDDTFALARLYYAYRHEYRVHEDIFVCRTWAEAKMRLQAVSTGDDQPSTPLPVARQPRGIPARPVAPSRLPAESGSPAAWSVLVVCDAPVRTEALSSALIDAGFVALIYASTGAEAIARFESVAPAVALIDLPGQAGLDVCRALREADPSRRLRLLLVADVGVAGIETPPPNGLIARTASVESISSEARRIASMPEHRLLRWWDRRSARRGGRRSTDQSH